MSTDHATATETQAERIQGFLRQVQDSIYPEPDSAISRTLIPAVMDQVFEVVDLSPDAKILDVGCGTGLALQEFQKRGLTARGVALGSDVQTCRDLGFEVLERDMSDLGVEADSHDLLWCRHVLEHSVIPMFTLQEWRQAVKPGGHLYVEVPAPETDNRHEANPNHFSVLGLRMWVALFERSQLDLVRAKKLEFKTRAGPDVYFSFILRRR